MPDRQDALARLVTALSRLPGVDDRKVAGEAEGIWYQYLNAKDNEAISFEFNAGNRNAVDRFLASVTTLAAALPPAAYKKVKNTLYEMEKSIGSMYRQKFPETGGRPPMVCAPLVAEFVAESCERLTGQKPTVSTKDGKAYGDFLALLTEIFDLLGIHASAEKWARHAVSRLNSR